MRPVVDFTRAPTYPLAKFLDRWLRIRIDFKSPHSITNSASLADELSHIKLPPGSIFSSFDVIGLFPHIPKAIVIQRTGELLVEAGIPQAELSEFFDLLNLCWSPNFCQFNGKFSNFLKKLESRLDLPLVPSFPRFSCRSSNLICSHLAMDYYVMFITGTGT
jgi:hypothetical protein